MNLRNPLESLYNKKQLFISVVSILILLVSVVTGCATVEVNESNDGPYIVSTYPSSGDFNISRLTDISIRFSESMDTETQAEFRMLLSGSKVDGETRWMDSNTMLAFRPYKPLEANSLYQCILGIGKSKEGKGLRGAPYIWMFSTGN
ncbi:MAG: Ig-like domain-containing protein [Nitrospirae bacterium]|nr:Ig-like domain-containing protein [Nitrospirota bacterium]